MKQSSVLFPNKKTTGKRNWKIKSKKVCVSADKTLYCLVALMVLLHYFNLNAIKENHSCIPVNEASDAQKKVEIEAEVSKRLAALQATLEAEAKVRLFMVHMHVN